MNALEVAGLKKNYAGFSLNVSFALEEGKITGFIGRNGAGKTTTIKSLLSAKAPRHRRGSHFALLSRVGRLALQKIYAAFLS